MRFHLPHPPTLPLITLSLALFTAQVSARDVPPNIEALYNNVKKTGNCKNILKTGFYAKDDPPNSKSTLISLLRGKFRKGRGRQLIRALADRINLIAFSYCGDHLSEGVIYLQGTGGALADMDIVRLTFPSSPSHLLEYTNLNPHRTATASNTVPPTTAAVVPLKIHNPTPHSKTPLHRTTKASLVSTLLSTHMSYLEM